MTTEEITVLSLAGVSVHVRSDGPLTPAGELLKVELDGQGAVHLYQDREMKNKHAFVFWPSSWYGSGYALERNHHET